MNKNLTEILFILDRSGSMAHLEEDTIGGYNSFLKKQKNEEGEASVTTVLFDDEVDVGEGYISGRSYENLVVRAPRTEVQKGFAKVYLKNSLGWALDGEIIKTEE